MLVFSVCHPAGVCINVCLCMCMPCMCSCLHVLRSTHVPTCGCGYVCHEYMSLYIPGIPCVHVPLCSLCAYACVSCVHVSVCLYVHVPACSSVCQHVPACALCVMCVCPCMCLVLLTLTLCMYIYCTSRKAEWSTHTIPLPALHPHSCLAPSTHFPQHILWGLFLSLSLPMQADAMRHI